MYALCNHMVALRNLYLLLILYVIDVSPFTDTLCTLSLYFVLSMYSLCSLYVPHCTFHIALAHAPRTQYVFYQGSMYFSVNYLCVL